MTKNTEKAIQESLSLHFSTMADFPTFRQTYLTGNTIVVTVPDEFVRKYKKVWLRSDHSDRNWRVRLEDYVLTDGWEEFVAAHNLKDGDNLVFKHDRDEFFHVSVEPRSDTVDAQNDYGDISEEFTVDNGADVDVDVVNHSDGKESEDEGDEGNISEKKDQNPEVNSSPFVVRVSRYTLLHDRVDLGREFTLLYNGDNKRREIDVKNEQGRRWTMVLLLNKTTGVFYIKRGWKSFCCANGLSEGDLCKFKLVENGENPVLLLCSKESAINQSSSQEDGEEEEECPDAEAAVKGCKEEKSMSDEGLKGKEKKIPSRFVTLEYTPNRHTSGQLSLPRCFTRENGFKKPGEITLLNKDGRKWEAYLQMAGCKDNGSEWFYLRRGWREMCKANEVMVHDSFMLELIWDDANATPVLKFCSKIQNPESQHKGRRTTTRAFETLCQPKVEAHESKRVTREPEEQEGEKLAAMGPSYHTPTAKKSSSNKRKLQSTRISDQVSNVRQSIVDTLTTIKRFRTELETREENLEAALVEIDGLGEKISGITKILTK